MSKTKTLFTMALLVLLGSMGAAQAQDNFVVVELVTQPEPNARMGGENEMSGSAWLTFSNDGALQNTTITLHYSVPLAEDIPSSEGMDYTSAKATVVGTAENDKNDDNGTVVVTGIYGTNTTLVIRNVMLNVSGASGPVTVTAEIESSDATDFLRFDGPNIGTVIDDIVLGVKAEADAGIVRTRGTDAGGVTATLTIAEAYTDAFMVGTELDIEFSDIPKEATLTAEVTGIKEGKDADGKDPAETDPYATVSAVKDGSATVTLGLFTDDKMSEVKREAPDKVVLMLTLTAASSNDKISFPLDVGEITVEVTFAGKDFADAFTDDVTVFNIRPAQCELLFPVVSVLPPEANGMMNMWDTAISVTNPAYTDEKASGGLTFTFYAQADANGDIPEPAEGFTPSQGEGTGLSLDGTLAAGSTYQVMASKILDYANWGPRFVGHVHLLADYTNCSGLGWVTDWDTVNQAYSAVVIDADTGDNED